MTTVNLAAATADSVTPTQVVARAYFLGQSIKLDALSRESAVPPSPLIVPVGSGGHGVLFAYGAVVVFSLSEAATQDFLTTIQPHIDTPFKHPETESVAIQLSPGKDGKAQDGVILLSTLDLPRLQIVAEVLAKSVVLAYYEAGAAEVFDQIEPYAAELQHQRQTHPSGDQLLKQIGHTLMIQNKIVGRVEIVDKPELLWEYPELDRMYQRLEDEYEIRERHSVLERKLDLVSRTAETVLDLQRQQTGLRMELYVVILIVIEVLLSLYDLFIQT
ncbi:MAG: RMD1 family protein [Leptolyngbyaceae cyanobacterium SM2_5_2]|nr:RMD1 family protein [Leptolyngbyaceae cyanobacterium SM2_5_2]